MQTPNALAEIIIAKLRSLDDVESRTLENGTWLIRKNPPRRDGRFADAYLHEVYSGLRANQIYQLEALIGRKLPPDLRVLYEQANGMSLFYDSLSIRGLREDYSRALSVRLPVSLEYGNVIDRPEGQEKSGVDYVRFGFYSDDGSELAIALDGRREIYAFPRYRLQPVLFEWPDLESMLLSEIDRMADLYKLRTGNVDPLNVLPPPWRDEQ